MNTNINIKFGSTSSNPALTTTLCFSIGMICHIFFFKIVTSFAVAHEALSQSSLPNMTSIKIRSVCDIPYDDCRCSVQTAKNVFLQDCLTDHFLLYSRIFFQVSCILQICFVREVFTISGKHSRIVIYCLRITAVFIFVFIVNGIYHQNSCFNRRIHFFLFVTNGILIMLALHDILRDKNITGSRFRHHNTDNNLSATNDIASEEITGDEASEEIIDDEASEESTDDETFDEITNKPIVWENLL